MNREMEKTADPAAIKGETERGMALLIVLWVIVSAALIVSAFGATVRSGVSFATSEVQMTKAEALLDAGAEIAAAHLIDEDKPLRWLPDGRPHVASFAGAKLIITIGDPNGLIDLNKADKALILGLLKRYADSESQALLIRDRILLARGKQQDNKPEDEMSGATDDANNDQKQQTSQPLPFIDIAQLRELEGMSMPLYDKISPFVTVYGRDGHINPRTAPSEVLLSIPDISEADIASLQHDLDLAQDQSEGKQGAAFSDVTQHGGAYLADRVGPAYTVTVQTREAAGSGTLARMFVITTGLDPNAPYRQIAKKPIVSIQ